MPEVKIPDFPPTEPDIDEETRLALADWARKKNLHALSIGHFIMEFSQMEMTLSLFAGSRAPNQTLSHLLKDLNKKVSRSYRSKAIKKDDYKLWEKWIEAARFLIQHRNLIVHGVWAPDIFTGAYALAGQPGEPAPFERIEDLEYMMRIANRLNQALFGPVGRTLSIAISGQEKLRKSKTKAIVGKVAKVLRKWSDS